MIPYIDEEIRQAFRVIAAQSAHDKKKLREELRICLMEYLRAYGVGPAGKASDQIIKDIHVRIVSLKAQRGAT